MTDTTISDAVFYPEDEGTGVPDGDEDYDSAAYDALLSRYHGDTAYRGNGCELTNVVTTDGSETVDVTAGHAFVIDDASVTGGSRSGNPVVQSSFQQTYDTTLAGGSTPVYVVILPTTVTDLALDTDATNDVWLFVDPGGSNDTVQIRHGTGLSEPSLPSVKLGTANSADGSVTTLNAAPDVTAEALEATGSVTANGTEYAGTFATEGDLPDPSNFSVGAEATVESDPNNETSVYKLVDE